MRLPVLIVAAVLLVSPPLRAETPAASVSVDVSRVEGPLDPRLYGQLVEFMFEGVKSGLHAEVLRDRGFEQGADVTGLSRDWDRYPDRRNDDDAMRFRWDDSVAYPASRLLDRPEIEHSLRVDLEPDRPETERRGVYQARIPMRKVAYEGSFWAKADGFQGTLTAALEEDRTGGEVYAEARVTGVQGDWTQYRFRLVPSQADAHARFALLFHGRGRLWVDQVSLMPADAVAGTRADVTALARRLRPAFLRWPGGNVAQDYHWQWGVGPRDRRPTWVNLSWQSELEPSDFGTDEYVAYARALGAIPSICVNVEGRGATVEEAVGWLEYCNGDAGTPYGRLRAENGNPRPHDVLLWEIGNEIWGPWVRGHSDARTYAGNLLRYADALRSRDPRIELIGVGDNDPRWNREVLARAGDRLDYLAIHHYYGLREMAGDPRNLMARPLFYERFYRETADLIRELVPGRRIRLAINEWNTALPLPRQHSMESALYAARLMNVFERCGDIVALTAVSDMVNGWSGGVIQASRHDVFMTPTGLANVLYAAHLGRERVHAEVTGPTFDTTREGTGIPFLDAVASRAGGNLYLKVVNTDPERALRTTFSVAGARPRSRGTWKLLNGPTLHAANDFQHPDRVRITERPLDAGPRFTLDLPAHSVSVLILPLED